MGFYPRTDIFNDVYGVNFHISIPGLNAENVKLEFSGSNLMVSGRHFERDSYAKYISKELYTGFFSRTYIINTAKFDITKIESKMINGLLQIKIPYKNNTNIKKIETINIDEV